MTPAHRPLRSGAALIIALVILAALMLLGLPFIFSQSGALAGTRAFARGQTAQVGMGAAENSGIGLAGNAAARHLLPGASVGLTKDQEWSRVDWDLDTLYTAGVGSVNPVRWSYFDGRRYQIDWLSTPLASAAPLPDQIRRDLLGLTIEDEGGKLDPNHLDAAGWQRLLAAQDVGIADPNDPADHDTYGQLAKALANLRFTLPGGRITDFEQLLGAMPNGVAPLGPGRQHLTKAELAHLRPHLSLSNLAQARAGLIDLGTVTVVDAPPLTPTVVPYLDSLPPSKAVAFPVTPDLVGAGTVLVSQVGTATPQISRLANGDLASNTTVTLPNTVTLTPLVVDAALAIEAPPAVNVHEALATTLAILRLPNIANPGLSTPLPAMTNDTLGKLRSVNAQADARTATSAPAVAGPPMTAFDMLDPLAGYDELGTAILGQTQVIDGAGNGPFVDTDGTTPIVAQGASTLHLLSGNFDRIPTNGYARIHGNHAGGATPPVTGPDEFISYSFSPIPPYALTNVTLVSLVSGAPATPASFRVEPGFPVITFIAPHEQAPVAIASPGVVTIDSSATVTDAQGKPDAKRGRRIVAQALPQEAPLETRWTTQSQIQALLASRQGSLMTSFPNPVQRVTNLATSDLAVQPTGELQTSSGPPVIGEDDVTGIKPGVLPSPHDNQLGYAWSRIFSGTSATDLTGVWQRGISAGPPAQNPLKSLEQVLSPEGVRTGIGDKALAYPNTTNGFITYVNDTGNGGVSTVAPFHFSIWIKPTVPVSETVTIFEMRMPDSNTGVPLAGPTTSGRSTDWQNRVSLRYIAAAGSNPNFNQFSLIVNNGAIEHTHDYGPTVDPDRFVDAFIDPQSLAGTAGGLALSPSRNNQTIKLRYYVGADGLKPNVWHLVQGVVGGNAPGGLSLMVDGIVGREATRLDAAHTTVALSEPGDHITIPTLVLKTTMPLPTTTATGDAKAALIGQESITLDSYTTDASGNAVSGGNAVKTLIPLRGMIRIGQEFISYAGIDADGTLHNLVRGRRQDMDGLSAVDAERWPVLQAHAVGDLVVPGGYRISPHTNPALPLQIFRGGCTLAGALPTGDALQEFRNWTAFALPPMPAQLAFAPTATFLDVTGGVVAGISVGSIIDASGNIQWPQHGLIRLHATAEVIYYSSIERLGPNTCRLQGLQRGRLGTTAVDIEGNPSDVAIYLDSIEVAGPDPTEASRYERTGDKLFQLYNPVRGHIEWISYSDIDFVDGHGFFVDRINDFNWKANDASFTALQMATWSRGRERTARQAWSASDVADGTLALPVQTRFDREGYLVATGDVLTIAPRNPSGDKKPLQVCVRYAPTDGFFSGSAYSVDTHNHYFAFTTALPEPVDPTNLDPVTWACDTTPNHNHDFDLLCWPCWNAEKDLSPYLPLTFLPEPNPTGPAILPPYQMPWAKSFNPGFTATGGNDDARIYFGSLDDRATRYPAGASFSTDPFPGLLDTPQSCPISPMRTMTSSSVSGTIWLSKSDGISQLNGIKINYSNGTFPQENGLVMIGDEVFAFERIDVPTDPNDAPQGTAKLVGRSLLGSKAVDHILYEKLIFLPIGPVTELATALPVPATGHVTFRLGDRIDAPAYLICSPDGQDMEIVSLPGMITAPWLRGMYGTMPRAWPTAAGTPLVIAWWPRYPSAFPHATGLAAMGLISGQPSNLLRCRAYAWASFPVRYHDTYFVDADPFTIDFPPRPPDSNVTVSYAAMVNGLDWNFAMFKSPYAAASGPPTASGQLFTAMPFASSGHAQPVDGAEIRVIWQYATAPYTGTDPVAFLAQAAANANQAPMFGPAKIVARAPSKILAVVPP